MAFLFIHFICILSINYVEIKQFIYFFYNFHLYTFMFSDNLSLAVMSL